MAQQRVFRAVDQRLDDQRVEARGDQHEASAGARDQKAFECFHEDDEGLGHRWPAP
jgi:hypothetical protein